MRVLIDVNVALDVLANREPHVREAERVLQLAEARLIDGLLAAHTVTTLHYLLTKHLSKAKAKRIVNDLLGIVSVVAVDEDRIRHALALGWTDFEDAVQASCAEAAGAQYLVTRDKRGFKRSAVKPVTPGELLALLH